MILYNVTVKVDNKVVEDWEKWMKDKHIPDVMNTGLFERYNFCRLLEHQDDDGVTYAIQYFCPSMKHYEQYQKEYAPTLQQEHKDRYGEQALAFRTLMEVIDS